MNQEELNFIEKNAKLPSIEKDDQISTDAYWNLEYGRIIDCLLTILPFLENNFAFGVLNNADGTNNPYDTAKEYSDTRNFQPILMHWFQYLIELFREIGKTSESGPDFSKNIRSKAMRKLIRHNREEDNFLFILQSTLDSLRYIQWQFDKYERTEAVGKNENGEIYIDAAQISGLKQIDVMCPLYGWIEMPFILKAISDMLKTGISIQPKLIAYSYYDLKNANSWINIAQYPIIDQHKGNPLALFQHFIKRKINNIISWTWCLILDDNIYTGRTLNDLHARFNKEYFKVFITTAANKTKWSKAVAYEDTKKLLKEVIPTSWYSIPDKGWKNGIVYKIWNRLKSAKRHDSR